MRTASGVTMSDYYESNLRAIIEEETYWLSALEAAAEDTRQRDLTVSLGQVECGAHDRHHRAWFTRKCRLCGAAL